MKLYSLKYVVIRETLWLLKHISIEYKHSNVNSKEQNLKQIQVFILQEFGVKFYLMKLMVYG